MKRRIVKFLALSMAVLVGFGVFLTGTTYAEEGAESTENTSESTKTNSGTSISLTPVNKILQISPSSVYDDTITVTNNGGAELSIEVYAAPYFYVYSETEQTYKLGYNTENNYTQIARWITIKDKNGEYVTKPGFKIPAGESLEVSYRISTPNDIPAGGQYAVIFVHTISNASGIRTEASPGIVVYGRSTTGETITAANFSDLEIRQTKTENNKDSNIINAVAKVKNNGNVDFTARGVLKVDGILNGAHYETPDNRGRVSVIPDAELTVSDSWDETPFFGFFKVSWTVTAGGETEHVEKIVVINLISFLIIVFVVLTTITVFVIIRVRKRKERRSRFSV